MSFSILLRHEPVYGSLEWNVVLILSRFFYGFIHSYTVAELTIFHLLRDSPFPVVCSPQSVAHIWQGIPRGSLMVLEVVCSFLYTVNLKTTSWKFDYSPFSAFENSCRARWKKASEDIDLCPSFSLGQASSKWQELAAYWVSAYSIALLACLGAWRQREGLGGGGGEGDEAEQEMKRKCGVYYL